MSTSSAAGMNARSATAPPFQQSMVSTRIGRPIHTTTSEPAGASAVTVNQKRPTAKLAIR
jgi:hypothetical protein